MQKFLFIVIGNYLMIINWASNPQFIIVHGWIYTILNNMALNDTLYCRYIINKNLIIAMITFNSRFRFRGGKVRHRKISSLNEVNYPANV